MGRRHFSQLDLCFLVLAAQIEDRSHSCPLEAAQCYLRYVEFCLRNQLASPSALRFGAKERRNTKSTSPDFSHRVLAASILPNRSGVELFEVERRDLGTDWKLG